MNIALLPTRSLVCTVAGFLAAWCMWPASSLPAQSACYFGVYETGGNDASTANGIAAINGFEADAGKKVSILNKFHSWATGSDTPSSAFPLADLNAVRARGSIPLFSWQPQDGTAGTVQSFTLAKIISGQYDNYITTWATAAKNWGHPLFLRFAHEMNGNWYPWSEGVNGNAAGQYVQMWRHVHDIFTRVGVTNVTWVWCVNTIYTGSTDIAELYPGDNYVDWVSFDAYNRGGSKAKVFDELITPTHTKLLSITNGKPIMIAEEGTVEDIATPKDKWFHDTLMYYLESKFPLIKAYCYFNVDSHGYDNRIETSATSQDAFATGIALSYFATNTFGSITDSPIQPLLYDKQTTDTVAPFVSIAAPNVGTVTAGATTQIAVNAADKNGVNRVEIFVNGGLAQTFSTAPYQYAWSVPTQGGAVYVVSAKAYDTSGNVSTSTASFVSQLVTPVITSAGSAAAQVGTAFSYQITAMNAPSVFRASFLPDGLQVDSKTGIISGTPTTAGSFPVTLLAGNATGTGSANLTLTVTDVAPAPTPTPAPHLAPVITSEANAAAPLTQAFRYQIVASNAPTAFTAAGLPDGLTVDTASGLISGTPRAMGTYTVNLGASNVDGTSTLTLTLTVGQAPLPVVIIMATIPATTSSSAAPAVMMVSRGGDLSAALTVNYVIKGSGIGGTDYRLLKGSKKIKPGKNSALIKIYPLGDLGGAAVKTVKLKLQPDASYTLATPAQAKISILSTLSP